MKHFLLCCAVYISCTASFKAQTFSKNPFNDGYRAYIKIAEEHYDKKEYALAAENYSKAFVANNGGGALTTDMIRLAGCWARVGQKDSAFSRLPVFKSGRYTKYNGLLLNPDFNSLHDDNRWIEAIAQVKENRVKYNPALNATMAELLDTVLQTDQKYRLMEPELKEKYGANSKELNRLHRTIQMYDSINQVRVLSILDQYGWPSSATTGDEGSTTLFLVIQHADLAVQEKYLPFVRDAVQRKTIPPSHLALLEDRIAIAKGGKQTYGSQVAMDKNGKYYVEPIMDPKTVDLRRAGIGLGPLAEYLKKWDIEWPGN